MTHYIALIHKESASSYGVSLPDVPGVTLVADTLDDALHEAGVALAFAFEDWQGDLPVPRTLDASRDDADFIVWSREAVVAAIAPAKGMANFA